MGHVQTSKIWQHLVWNDPTFFLKSLGRPEYLVVFFPKILRRQDFLVVCHFEDFMRLAFIFFILKRY